MREIPVRFRVSPLEVSVPWSSGNDSGVTYRQRWFDSIRDDSTELSESISNSSSEQNDTSLV